MSERFPPRVTPGEKYGPAMEIREQSQADAYLERCIQHAMEVAELDRESADALERSNLAYWAGYYDNETRERVERLFRCAHPIFGALRENGPRSA